MNDSKGTRVPEKFEYDLVVIGSGPGGYTAAFRAADLGLRVALIERYPALGGVCLNVGCIPSKALLHAGRVIDEAAAMKEHGVNFGEPSIDLDKLRGFKDGVVSKLTGGLAGMAKKRKVEFIQGVAEFSGPNGITVSGGKNGSADSREIGFERAIIAVGSQSLELSGLPWGDPRLMDSTGALELEDIPDRLLVIGGGIIGLEMACVYQALGSEITVAELMPQLMPGADPDLVKPLQRRISNRYKNIYLETKVNRVDVADDYLVAHFDGKFSGTENFDRILVAVGRTPNGGKIKAKKAGVNVTSGGFIPVDHQMRTNVSHIFAIGDVVGQPMLAHKATHEGKVAAEVCAGKKSAFDARVIPSVAYTDPEVAWVGITETEAKEKGLEYGVGKFPWAASGRALGMDCSEGFTKLIFDESSRLIIGAGITGANAGELISECALAIEMNCEAEDLSLTIHPHPTLSESISMAAEVFEGTITDLYIPQKKTSSSTS
jgi:dihydrolipoamide dehydrogenase